MFRLRHWNFFCSTFGILGALGEAKRHYVDLREVAFSVFNSNMWLRLMDAKDVADDAQRGDAKRELNENMLIRSTCANLS